MLNLKTHSNLIVKQILIQLIVLCTFTISIQVTASDYYPLESTDQHDCEYDTLAYDPDTNNCSDPICPRDSIGIFPDCKCTDSNFDYSVSLNKCFRVCPENSAGYWPNCTCFRGSFDKTNFQCIECPASTSSGIYPNCVCNDENSRFNAFKNYCEYCPVGSSGTIPSCVCDDGADYVAIRNRCQKCSYGSSGTYPNCTCNDPGGHFNGAYCVYCPRNSHGIYGECICDGNTNYVKDKNLCVTCGWPSFGHYPNCNCNEPLIYDREANSCFQCPTGSTGIYPNCQCKSGIFGRANRACIECPIDSKGAYPQCECTESGKIFSAFINECYIECGDKNSTGLHPDCICDDIDSYYDSDTKKCKSIVGRTCPEDSIGIGPDCLCMIEEHVFMVSLWECDSEYLGMPFSPGTECPDSQRWPQCSVSIDQKVLATLIG